MPRSPSGPAERLVLRLDDLLRPGWRADATSSDPASGPTGFAEALLSGDVPETAVTAAADSERFVLDPAAAAFSAALLLRDRQAAEEAWTVLASPSFAQGFAEAVTAVVTPRPGDLEILAVDSRAIGDTSATTAGHRSVLATAGVSGMTPIVIDLLALRHETAIVLVWLLDSPDPVPDHERRQVAEQIRRRLGSFRG